MTLVQMAPALAAVLRRVLHSTVVWPFFNVRTQGFTGIYDITANDLYRKTSCSNIQNGSWNLGLAYGPIHRALCLNAMIQIRPIRLLRVISSLPYLSIHSSRQ